jgi:hypothetical protein
MQDTGAVEKVMMIDEQVSRDTTHGSKRSMGQRALHEQAAIFSCRRFQSDLRQRLHQ